MNKEKLVAECDEIAEFDYNWDGYGAEPFTGKTIDRTKVVIDCLDNKYPDPDVVPSQVGICLDWEYGENALEIYVGEGGEERVSYLKVVGDDMKDWTETDILDISEINELLEWLYGE